ncbi:MAG: hypothetical protein GXO92_01195 [FCB group bacterium]|nr:hypothetical protein [FCB group bacterium]
MHIPLKTRLSLWWRGFRHRGADDNSLLISSRGKGVSSILFILPDAPETIRLVNHFFKSLSLTDKPDLELRFVCEQSVLKFFEQTIRAPIITYTEKDLNWWRLPRKEFTDKVFAQPVDAVVDLCPKFRPVSATVIQVSNAPLRIGFLSKWADRYFNVVMIHRSGDLLEKAYLNMRRLLGL